MVCIVKQRLGASNLAGHHRMSMTHPYIRLTSSLWDLCASQNALSFIIQLPVKLFYLYMHCVLVLVRMKSDTHKIEKESLVNGLS